MNLPKMDSTTIHGISVVAVALLTLGATVAGMVANGSNAQAVLAAAVYGIVHIFLPQAPGS